MPGCEGDVVVESKDFAAWASCSCGWKGVAHHGDADSVHDDALADRANHLTGLHAVIRPDAGAGQAHHEHDQLPLAG